MIDTKIALVLVIVAAVAVACSTMLATDAYGSKLFNPDYRKNWSAEIDR